MIAPVLHARPLIASTTKTHTGIPEWQLRRVQRELDLCRRLMHASRKAARRSERDRISTMPRHGAGGTGGGGGKKREIPTERQRGPRIPGALR
jgi:hypothetical protein